MSANVSQLLSLAGDLSRTGARTTAALARQVRVSAAAIHADAVARAPVGETGALRASIAVTVNGPLSATVSTGDSVYYAAFQEYGTSRMAPRPFMNAAADSAEESFYDAVRRIRFGL